MTPYLLFRLYRAFFLIVQGAVLLRNAREALATYRDVKLLVEQIMPLVPPSLKTRSLEYARKKTFRALRQNRLCLIMDALLTLLLVFLNVIIWF